MHELMTQPRGQPGRRIRSEYTQLSPDLLSKGYAREPISPRKKFVVATFPACSLPETTDP